MTIYVREVKAVQREVRRYLEFCTQKLGRTPEQMRVLDFGCGAGGATLDLRKLGYQAFGVDIDPVATSQGMQRMRAEGFDDADILVTVDADGSMPFPEHCFDFVFSQEVLEHVADLDRAAADLSRMMAPSGYGFHRFPGRRRPVEPHYLMPFVHWLPKNKLRRAAILGLLRIGVGKRHPDYPESAWRDHAERWFQYSVQHTFYRSTEQVVESLRRAGQDVCVVSSNHRRLQCSKLLRTALRSPYVRRAVDSGVSTFVTNNLLTRTAKGQTDSPELLIGGWRSEWLPATGQTESTSVPG
jgi:SAM-dependent methyltransferase